MGKDSYKNILQENYEIWDCFCQSLFGIQGYDRQLYEKPCSVLGRCQKMAKTFLIENKAENIITYVTQWILSLFKSSNYDWKKTTP